MYFDLLKVHVTFDDYLKYIERQWEGVGTSSAIGKGVEPLHTRLLSHTKGVGSKPCNREMHVLVEMSMDTGDYKYNIILIYFYFSFI